MWLFGSLLLKLGMKRDNFLMKGATMNPFTAGFLASVIANGLTTIVTHLGSLGIKRARGERNVIATVARDSSLGSILQKATASFARQLKKMPETLVDRLKVFLVSPDVDAIVRQVYATKLGGHNTIRDRVQLRSEFQASLQFYLGEKLGEVSIFSETLFTALVEGCDRALDVAIDKGFLSAHEAKSAARANLVMGELQAIRANLKFLSQKDRSHPREIEEFEESLRSQIGSRHGFIVPPHFDSRRRVPIDDLYVLPTFTFAGKKSQRHSAERELSLDHFMSFLFRAVVLGNPGSGKSTLASRICSSLAEHYSDKALGGRRVTPILVVLRDYGGAKKDRGLSILQFLEELVRSTYQIPPPNRAIEHLLRTGRLFVIFDGLDELLDTSYRQQVSADVESFSSLYSSVPILVTSRKVGYEQAPLDHETFELFHIAPFDETQVDEYVRKWFAADEEMSQAQREEKAETFLKESRSVPDLRSNPLMLALLCNIYKGENYIPRNRPDVYEKCAVMLFEKWDKSRGIYVPLPFEAHVRPAMMHLAHWIYSNETLQGGVTEAALIGETTCYLRPRRYEDLDEARQAAIDFIDFCRGRAWVFTDTGTTREGDPFFQFTHRTFLEYFTAAHLVRTNPTPEQLIKVLSPRIAAREWDVVAQLACQIQSKQTEGACDVILEKLLHFSEYTRRSVVSQGNLLSFACRALQFLIPSPALAKKVILSGLNCSINIAQNRLTRAATVGGRRYRRKYDQPDEIIYAVLSVAQENRTPVAATLEAELVHGLTSGKSGRKIVTLQLALNLSSFLFFPLFDYFEIDEALSKFWSSVAQRVLSKENQTARELCSADRITCLNALYSDFITMPDVLGWHGTESLFVGGNLALSARHGVAPFIPIMLLHLLDMGEGKSRVEKEYLEKWRDRLSKAAEALLNSVPPWISREYVKSVWHFDMLYPFGRHYQFSPRDLDRWGSNISFLLMVAAGIQFEISKDPEEFLGALGTHSGEHPYRAFRHTLKLRGGSGRPENSRKELEKVSLSAKQRALSTAWAMSDITFTDKTG